MNDSEYRAHSATTRFTKRNALLSKSAIFAATILKGSLAHATIVVETGSDDAGHNDLANACDLPPISAPLCNFSSAGWRPTLSKYFLAIVFTIALVSVGGCDHTTQNTPSQNEGTSKRVDDSVITANVKAAIQEAPALEFTEINVETDKGVVHISGIIKSQSDMRDVSRAIELASRVEGVAYVRPDLRIGSNP